MTNKSKSIMEWTISIVLIFCAILVPLMLCGGQTWAEEIAGGDGAGDTEIVEDTQDNGGFGAWIKANWQTIVQAFAGVSGVAAVSAMIGVVTQIVKFIKICKSGNASTDELKAVFNALVDEVNDIKNHTNAMLKDESAALAVLADAGKTTADKQAALLGVVQRLIDMSELPHETKVSLTGLINGGITDEQAAER